MSRRQPLTSTITFCGEPQKIIAKKLVVHRAQYPRMLTEKWVDKRSVVVLQQAEQQQIWENCAPKSIQEFGRASQGVSGGWSLWNKSKHTQKNTRHVLQMSHSSGLWFSEIQGHCSHLPGLPRALHASLC